MILSLIAAALAATASPSALPSRAAPVDASPALWVVNDEDTIIYLFGTFHALDGRTYWFNDEVRTAFVGSDELILETLVPKPILPPSSWERSSSTNQWQRVPPLGRYAGSSSLLSTSRMVMSAGREQGMSTDHGADSVLRQAAENAGKPVGALESFESQLRMFAALPGASKPRDAQQAGTVKAAMSALLHRLQQAWGRGDIESFTPMLDEMRTRSPQMYKQMFTDRNQRWAGWIAHRLQQPGTVFVAVGAGHLAGQDSVQRKLAQANIRTERLN